MRQRQTTNALFYEGDSLDRYFHDISLIPIMPHEKIVSLSREYHNPRTSPERRDEIAGEMASSNLRFVVSVAKGYRGSGNIPLEDLISAGNVGLMKAARKYDPEQGVKFISYAVWWIRQALHQYVAENERQARIPLSRAPKQNQVKRLMHEFMAAGMSENEAFYGALKAANVDSESFLTIEGLTMPMRLDSPAHGNERSKESLGERLPYNTGSANETAERNDLHEQIAAALQTLSQREAYILRAYYGLNEKGEMTLEEIGKAEGVTRERVRQIKERALQRLKAGSSGGALRELFDEDSQ